MGNIATVVFDRDALIVQHNNNQTAVLCTSMKEQFKSGKQIMFCVLRQSGYLRFD